MYPPVFQACSASADVTARLGGDIVRLYPFGGAVENCERPYAVWSVFSGSPENYMDKAPDCDLWSVQIDVYAETAEDSRLTAEAIREAIQALANITGWRGESIDPETRLYRLSFDVDWWLSRG